MDYCKSKKYNDFVKIYKNCSGPGTIELAEFLAEKMGLETGKRMLDVGFYRGYQTCFLAKEYGVNIIGIDPGGKLGDTRYGVAPLMENAREFGVEYQVFGVGTGVPESKLPAESFDYAYTTNCLHMTRVSKGEGRYLECIKEIHRLLKKGGILGLGEPMHFDVPKDDRQYAAANVVSNVKTIAEAGFEILDSGYCDDGVRWWRDYCTNSHDMDATRYINADEGKWLTMGFVIAVKK